MRLTNDDLERIAKRVVDHGLSTQLVAAQFDVCRRRIQRIAREYRLTGAIPRLGRPGRRPYARYPQDIRERILRLHRKIRRGSCDVADYLRKKEGIRIGNDAVHGILKAERLVKENPNMKERKRPWVRYEREHSLSAAHMDWYQNENGEWVCAVLDDASRMVLAGGEFAQRSADAAVSLLQQVLDRYGHIRPLREVITDHGSEFYANKRDRDGNAEHRFERFCRENGIEHILCRYNRPQSNGKIEKWFDTYQRHRPVFDSFDEFVDWYNRIRPHRSLDWDVFETPERAFYRKCQEFVLGNFMAMAEKESEVIEDEAN